MMSEQLSKLQIIPLKKNIANAGEKPDFDTSNAVKAHFNPDSLSLSKSNNWVHRPSIGESLPKTNFSGGCAGSLTIELLFDTTDKGTKVTEEYHKLFDFLLVQPSDNADKKGEPRQVVIIWGEFLSYICVIQSLSQTFTFFLPDGTPLRSTVTLKLREVVDATKLKPQNPTSRSEARRTWVVEKGQRIEWIAHEAYGTTAAWRHLANVNNIMNPAMLRPGQILKLTPLT